MIFGWDASDYDWDRGPMDVGAAVKDGITFFTHKATEGTSIKHVHYGEALSRARAAGMPLMGAYMVVRTPGNNGHGTVAQQVAYFLAYLDAATPWWRSTPEFFLQVDLEHWGYDNVEPQLGVDACGLLRAQTGKWVVLYAPRWAYGDTIPGSDPLWASSYGANPAVPYRQAYPGDNASGWTSYSGRMPMILQYGSRLTIGSQPGCDANAFRGSLAQLRALITGDDMALGDIVPNTGGRDLGTCISDLWNFETQGKSGVDGAKLARQQQLDRIDAEAHAGAAPATVALSDTQLQAVVDGVTAKLAALIPTPAQIAAAAADEEAKRLSNG